MAEKARATSRRLALLALGLFSIDRVIAIAVAGALTAAVSTPLAASALEAQREQSRAATVETSLGILDLDDDRFPDAPAAGQPSTGLALAAPDVAADGGSDADGSGDGDGGADDSPPDSSTDSGADEPPPEDASDDPAPPPADDDGDDDGEEPAPEPEDADENAPDEDRGDRSNEADSEDDDDDEDAEDAADDDGSEDEVVETPDPTPTKTPEATTAPVPTATTAPNPLTTAVPVATNTPVPTSTPAATSTPVPTATPTRVPTATSTPVPTATSTPIPTATSTPIPTATSTPIPTANSTPAPTTTLTPTSQPQPTSITARITQSIDDAEERLPGQLLITGSSDLDFTSRTRIGLRYSVCVPADAVISQASITFTAEEPSGVPTQASFWGQRKGDTESFIERPIVVRVRTQSRIDWDLPEFVTNQRYASPDLADIVTEIVTGDDWTGCGNIVFIIEADGDRGAWSFDADTDPQAPPLSPVLNIELED